MREGWTYKKLGEVCEILNGYAFKSNKYTTEGVRVIRITNVQKGYIEDYDPKFYPIETQNELMRYLLKDRDLLLSLTGNVGRVAIIDKSYLPAYLNQRVACIRTKDNNRLDLKYLFHLLYSKKFEEDCIQSSTGAAQLNMSTVWLASYPIPIPPLSEQKAIVSRLDSAFAKIDALKANAKKQLDDAKALFQKALEKAMEPKEGWEEKRFGDVCLYHKEQGIFKDMRYLGMEHMESGTGRILGYGSSNDVLSNTFKFNKGEVLYGRLRPYLQKVYVAEFDGCCSTEVFPIISEKVVSGFIKYWLLSEKITTKINATSAGCRMPRGNMNEVKTFEFFYPKEKTEQQRIVERLDDLSEKVKRLQEIQEKTIKECDALKQAILREVFE